CPCVHYLVEHDVALVRLLRVIHRDIGITKQFVRIFIPRTAEGDTDAHTCKYLAAFELKRELHLTRYQLRKVLGLTLILYSIQQDRELVSAEAADMSAIAGETGEAPPDIEDQAIAHRVAKAVIYGLESIEIKK